jgi:hypothetical protein
MLNADSRFARQERSVKIKREICQQETEIAKGTKIE